MTTMLNHIALEYSEGNDAKIFFSDILGLDKIKSFYLDENLSEKIFNISQRVDIDVYANRNVRFEIFITHKTKQSSFIHTCIEIQSKEDFVNKCKKYGLNPYFVKKGEKDLLFVKDFSNNLYEIKEK